VFGVDGISKLGDFTFAGSFYGTCLVSVEDLPVDIIFDVSVPDLVDASSVDFGLSIDLNLVPVRDDIGALLDDVDLLSYSGDGPFAEYERFLPTIDLSCIKDSGKAYLNQTNSSLPVSGFFDAIADGCSNNELFELLGGYNASSGELGMNVQLELSVGRSANDAVRALSGLLSSNGLSLGDEFSNTLSIFDGIEVGGRIFLDFNFGVRGIPKEEYNSTTFSAIIDPYFAINGFELEASLRGDDINMTLPVSIQNPGSTSSRELLELSLQQGLISIEFSAVLDQATTPAELLSGNSSMTLSGEMDVFFPVVADVADVEFGLDLFIQDNDLFDDTPMSFGYDIDSCSVRNATEELFERLADEIEDQVNAVLGEGDNLPVKINTDKLLGGLTTPLRNLTNQIRRSFSDCAESEGRRLRRILDSNVTTDGNFTAVSFEKRVRMAFESIDQSLRDIGIVIDPVITPNFDQTNFGLGLSLNLTVTASRTAEEIKAQLGDFENVFASATNTSSENSSSLDALAVEGTNETSVVDINVDDLLNNTVVFASFDIAFKIEIELKEMQKVLSGTSFDDAIASGVVLTITDYGAKAGLVVDPINIEVNLGSSSLAVRDSSFVLSAQLDKVEGAWQYSVQNLIENDFTAAKLEPEPFQLSLFSEIVVDVNVSDVLTVSPIIELSSTNLIGGGIDVGFEAFLAICKTFSKTSLLMLRK
jgi:hypothetical protein